VDHLDVVGRLTPSMKWKPRIHNAPLVGTSSQRDDVNNVTASGSVKIDDAPYLSMGDERFYDDVDNSQNSKWTVKKQ
jgi:hypothetical protein